LVITGVIWQHGSAIKNQITSGSTDVNPGKEGAILTLADGTKIILDSASEGIIASSNEGNMQLAQGQLIYRRKNTENSSEFFDQSASPNPDSISAFHTLTTPKGRQFNLQLPDGTRVW